MQVRIRNGQGILHRSQHEPQHRLITTFVSLNHALLTARVPIMRFTHPSSRRDLDISGIEQAIKAAPWSFFKKRHGLHISLYSHRGFPGFNFWKDHMAAHRIFDAFSS